MIVLRAQQVEVVAARSDIGRFHFLDETRLRLDYSRCYGRARGRRRAGATLLVAKFDRLSWNAGFVFALRDSSVDFVCYDMSDASTRTVGLLAVVAQCGQLRAEAAEI